MRKAVYAGSFDPITLGHVNIIERLGPLYDELYILVANATHKTYMFSPEDRAQLIRESIHSPRNVKVEIFDGLTVEFAEKVGASVVIRGIRMVNDFENEMAMASINKNLNKKVETLVIFSSPEFGYISSRLVKEVAQFGGSLEKLVPPPVQSALSKKFKNRS